MSEETLMIDPPEEISSTQAPGTLPRLLAGIPAHGAMSLDEHLTVHGQAPLSPRRRGRRSESPLIDQVERAGLRGHGGAGFPTATKLRAVAASRKRAVVVVNAAEGEPASLKDRTLMQTLPHLVLDGAQLAAQAVGADELIVCVCESAQASVEASTHAITERRGMSSDSARMHLTAVPGTYVAGQEAALVNHLNGGPAIPTFTPPMVFEQGVRRRPTLVANAETLAHLALIARHGPEWFRRLGTPSQPGSTLVTLSGALAHPGVYEIEHGASLVSLIDAAGGTLANPRALLVGGYGGSWIGGEFLRGVALSDEHLAPHGASLGAGVVLLLSEDTCPVAETARVTRWLAGQSAGQCGPCVHGLDSIATSVAEVAGGLAQGNATQRIARLAGLVHRRGACGHPDGAARFVTSALDAFGPEFADHARHGPCDGCTRPGELPLPVHHPAAAPTHEPVSFR
ncbi:MAG TPA: NADH-ubiquinone oxidoreductase-F iron-sulfur binding region domain-containing protein [Solirubrobacteraceae bacterium]|nr:NADH-ubiquinone oxidoreductase-F iron-sulfur binding region domain-containing protein [Solirubrobacteraceae bacterium]